MTYVIAQSCVDVKGCACVDECPVDYIYKGKRNPYINAGGYADYGACESTYPIEAIFYEDDVPEEWEDCIRANINFSELREFGSPGGVQRIGMSGHDNPMITVPPPQNEEQKRTNGY